MNELMCQWMGGIAGNLAATVLTWLAALGAGSWLCRRLTGQNDLRIAVAAGFVLLAALMLAGSPVLLSIPDASLASLLAIPALYGARELRDIHWRQFDPTATVLLAAGGLAMLGSALLIPYAWDEQTYQLAVVRHWLQLGSVAPLADNPYSYFPSLFQLLLLYPVKIGGLGTARLMILAVYLAVYAGLYQELRRMLPKLPSLLLSLLFAISPVAATMAREVYVEPVIILMLIAGLRLRHLAANTFQRAILTGVLAGGAAAVKLTALGAAAVILLLGTRKPRGRVLLIAAVTAALTCGVFYLRSYLACGNPVYPFGAAIFAPGDRGALEVEHFHRLMGSFYYGISGVSGVLLGWFFAAFDELIFDGIAMGWDWALLIVFGVAGFAVARYKGRDTVLLRRYGGALAVLYVFWVFTSPQTRFLLPGLFFAVLFGAAALRRIGSGGRRIALLLLIAAFAANPDAQALLHFKRAWQTVVRSRTEPLKMLEITTREKDLGAIFEYLDRNTPGDTRVLMLFERRTLFAPRQCFNGTPGFQQWVFTPAPANAAELLAQLSEHWIDYLVIGASPRNPDHLEEYNQTNAELSEMLRLLLKKGKLELVPVPDAPNYTLLRVEDPSGDDL
ncbi:MAG: hypothetical protein AB7F32_05465 [Victivallaceae bacterium]